MNITVNIFTEDKLLRIETLSSAVIKIGTLPSNHICLSDICGVARMHAVIEVEGPRDVFVQDLGAVTFVNGVRYFRRRILPGDAVDIGDARLVCEWDTSEDE